MQDHAGMVPAVSSSPFPGCRALFEEGGHAFLCVVRHGVEGHRFLGGGVSRGPVEIALRIVGLLAESEGEAAGGGDLFGELACCRGKVSGRDNAIYQTPLRRSRRVDGCSGKEHLQGALMSDSARERDTRGCAKEADLDARRGERGVRGSHGQVARSNQLAAYRGGHALYLRDYRLRKRLDEGH